MHALESIVLATACALASISAASAAQITADLSFLGGKVTIRDGGGAVVSDLNRGSLLDFSRFRAGATPESFSGTGGIGVAFPEQTDSDSGTGVVKDMSYAPFGGPVKDFFRIRDADGSNKLRFDLTSVLSTVVQNSVCQSLTVNGTGTMRLTG